MPNEEEKNLRKAYIKAKQAEKEAEILANKTAREVKGKIVKSTTGKVPSYNKIIESSVKSKIKKAKKEALNVADDLDESIKALAAKTIMDASRIGVTEEQANRIITKTKFTNRYKKKGNKIITTKVTLDKFSRQLRPSLAEYERDLLKFLSRSIGRGRGVESLAKGLLNVDKIKVPIPEYIRQIEAAARRAIRDPKDYAVFQSVLNRHRPYINALTRAGEEGFQQLGLRRAGRAFLRDIQKAISDNAIDNVVDRWAKRKLKYIQQRVARTATSDAYHAYLGEYAQSAEHIIGIKVKLSPSHPEYDICDDLAGEYLFDEVGREGVPYPTHHPNCLCGIEYIFKDEFLNNPDEFIEAA